MCTKRRPVGVLGMGTALPERAYGGAFTTCSHAGCIRARTTPGTRSIPGLSAFATPSIVPPASKPGQVARSPSPEPQPAARRGCSTQANGRRALAAEKAGSTRCAPRGFRRADEIYGAGYLIASKTNPDVVRALDVALKRTESSPPLYGARHKAAFSFVAASPGRVAFVISEDGPVTCAVRINGKVVAVSVQLRDVDGTALSMRDVTFADGTSIIGAGRTTVGGSGRWGMGPARISGPAYREHDQRGCERR